MMSNWTRSNVSREKLLRLVEAGQLPLPTTAVEWRVPGDESMLRPKGFVVSFMAFHERGFSVPAGRFIRGVLFEYGLHLQHLNSNSIQQMAAFEVMCEGYWESVPIGTFSGILQVRMLEGGVPGGDDQLRQPPDEAGPGQRLHHVVPN
jgi:hypothetical protein